MKKTPLELQEKRYDERRKGIKRLLAIVLLITVAVVVTALWASFRRRDRVVNVPSTLPSNVSRQLSGYTFTRTVKGREIFTIHAARTLAYEGARTELEGVSVVIYGARGGQRDEVTTDRCQYDNQTGALACAGKAQLQFEPIAQLAPGQGESQRVNLETSNISYNPKSSTIETPDAVSFTMGASSGAAVGLDYSTRSGALVLRKDVSFKVASRPGSAGPVRMTAGELVYNKRDRQITLNSPVSIEQGGEKITAAEGILSLDSQNRINRVSLAVVHARDADGSGELTLVADHLDAGIDPATGRVRLLSANGRVEIEDHEAKGGLRQITADNVTLDMTGTGSTSGPRSAEAQGNVKLVLDPSGKSASGSRILTAPKMLLTFLPGGSLKEAITSGASELRLIPANPRLSRQTLTAGKLQMAFDNQGRIETIHGYSSTRIVDQPAALAGRAAKGPQPMQDDRISSADDFAAEIDPAMGTLKRVQQSGHYNFEQGASRAVAHTAVYEAAKQQLTLSGNPEAWDKQGRVRAQHMVIDIGSGAATGWGQVQAIYFDPPRPGARAVTPVIVLANQVKMNKLRRTALFEGDVRAWRGANRVASPSLEIDLKLHRLESGHGVTTVLMQQPNLPGAGTRGKRAPEGLVQTVTIHAGSLEYSDLEHKAVYEGNVQMVSGATAFRSDRLAVYLTSASGNPEVERAIADGDVRVTQQPGRRATGQHAEYFASAGKIVLTGGPPVIYDPGEGYLSGKRLTFFIRDASLFADGGKKAPTLSKRRILKR